MMQSIINLMLIISTFMFSQLNHPLAMGFLLLIQTIVICLVTGNMASTFWFSYTLFLVFIGGMLVLFIYITSLASNEMFNLSLKLTFMMVLMILFMIMMALIFDNSMFSFNMNNEFINVNLMNHFKEGSSFINKLYNFPNNYMTLMLINYLLFTLIIVVKITNFFKGPLRNTN